MKAAAGLIAIVLAAGVVATAVGGAGAGLVVGLASGSAMAFGGVMSTRAAVVVTLLLGAAAALGTSVSERPWLAGAAVGATVLATAPASAYSAGMLMLAPLITLVLAVTDRGLVWWQAGLWGVVGGLVGLAIAAVMKYAKRAPNPLPWPVAWRHAVVLAVAAGGSIIVAESLGLPHGYWVTVALLVALRPSPDERGAYVAPRIIGTLLGAGLAVVVVLLVDPGLLMPIAFGFLVALAAYAMSGSYLMQTLFLTPALLILMSYGDDTGTAIELTLGRVLYTVIGAGLVGVLAWALQRWDARPSPTPSRTGRASGRDGS